MKEKWMVLLCFILLFMTSCKNTDSTKEPIETIKPTETEAAASLSPEQQKHSKSSASLFTITAKEKEAFETEVIKYDLGAKEYTAQSGKKMPYRIRGVIGVPKVNQSTTDSGTFPLILITHGSHSNEDESLRFDTGFSYLVEELAQNGYIAVSMDMSSAYLWKYGDSDDKEKSLHIADTQIQSLKSANDGKQIDFGIDLKGKINFEQVGFIGHSRGGDVIFDLALEQKKKGIGIAGLLAVAPVMPNDIETTEWPDIPVSILVPEYDGDVTTLDGLAIQAVLERKNDALHTATLLRYANHNYFNTNLKKNDAELMRNKEELKDQISKEKQQTFLQTFAVDFFDSVQGQPEGTLYEEGIATPNKLYGLDVMSRSKKGDDISLIEVSDSDSYRQDGLTVKLVTDSWFYEEDEIPADTVTFGQESIDKKKQLLSIVWEQAGTFTILPKVKNFSAYQTLSLQMITNPAAEENNTIENQKFTIVLQDEKGNTSSIVLPNGLNSLSKTPGELDKTPIFDKEAVFWSFPSPIFSTKLPLSEFKGVNMEKIVSVSLKFDQTQFGEIYLESVLLQ